MIKKEAFIIGMDMGTTNIKAILLSQRGQVVSKASRPVELIQDGPLHAEQDPEIWWLRSREIFMDLISDLGVERKEEIKAICISSHTVSMIPVNKEGQPLRHALVWMDKRSGDELSHIIDTIGFDHYVNIIGGQPDVVFLPNKILWYKNNEPSLFEQTHCFLQASSYINFKLTDQFSMDLDQAVRTQCMDINSLTWSSEIGQVIGLDFDKLMPKPVPVDQIIGHVTAKAAKETGLPLGIPVLAGASDAMAAMYAMGISEIGVAGESSGTSSLVFIGSKEKSQPNVPVVTKPCSIKGMPYIFDAPITSSGASIKWYLDQFGQEDRQEAEKLGMNLYDYLNKMADEVEPGCNGLMFFPYMRGERAPLWNDHSRGMFIGLSLSTTRKEMVRAIFEGTAFALRHVVETVRESGARVEKLKITGGGAGSSTWNKIKASVLNIEVLTIDDSIGGVPLGDALMAGTKVGVFSDLSEAVSKIVKINEVVSPDEKWTHLYDQLYPYYISMYQHLDEDLAGMHKLFLKK